MGDEFEEEEEGSPGLDDEDFPGFPADVCPSEAPDLSRHHSVLADIFKEDPTIYERLRERQTSLGVGLARCIKVGIDNRGHKMVKGVGMVAGDEECFDVFRELFDRAIQMQHSDEAVVGLCESHPTDLGRGGLGLQPQRADYSGKYVLSSSVRLSRNLAGYPFPPAMSREERHEVERLLAQALTLCCSASSADAYMPLQGSESYAPRPGGMSADEEVALQDAGLLFEAPDSTWRLCTGAGRHWPDGRGVFATGDHALVAWVNELEHLRLTSVEHGSNIQLAFRKAVQALDTVANELHRQGLVRGRHAYAYSSRLGFLTSNIANLGTAMTVGMTLRLPRLAHHKGSQWRDWCSVQRVHIRGATAGGGAGGGSLPGIFELSNVDRAGISEVATVNLVNHVAAELVRMEQRLELGLAIDDLLASVQLGGSHAELPSAQGAVPSPAETAAAAQKARATLLFGMAAGQLRYAIASVGGPQAVSKAASPEFVDEVEADVELVRRDCQSAAAELLISDVLEIAVEGHAVSQASNPHTICHTDQAEEVLDSGLVEEIRPSTGATMMSNGAASELSVNAEANVQTISAALASLQEVLDSGFAEETRPSTGATMMSVRAASELSVNAEAAMELVEGLMDIEIEARAEKVMAAEAEAAASQPQAAPARAALGAEQVLAAKQKVSKLLLDASSSGLLAGALSSVGQPASETAAAEVAPKGAGQDVASLRADLASLLERTLESGELQRSLQSLKPERSERERVEALRVEAMKTLCKAEANGELLAALEQSERDRIEALRVETMKTLCKAEANGELLAALESVWTQPQEAAQQPPPPEQQPAEARLAVAAAAAPPEVVGGQQMKPSVLLTLRLLSGHDRRLGELAGKVQFARRRLAERDEACRLLEEKIEAGKAEAAHLDLDIEWHRQALRSAEERSAELGLSQRKLLGSLDLHQQKALDAGPALNSARSEISTNTGYTAASTAMSGFSYTPRWGHTPLEPITAHRLQTS